MNRRGLDRRDLLKTSALAMGGAFLAEAAEAYPKAVNTNSSPSTLKITDLRVATVVQPGPGVNAGAKIDRLTPLERGDAAEEK
jgi:hypothetical protein